MAIRTFIRQGLRLVVRFLRWCLFAVLLYLIFVFVGLTPMNRDFEPSDDGIEIFVTSSEVHADIVVPLANEVHDWRSFIPTQATKTGIGKAKYIAFGWGDKGFYVHTRTWAELKVSTTVKAALLPTSCCMHVECLRTSDWAKANGKSVKISHEQYARLVNFIKSSFKTSAAGSVIQIDDAAYWDNDAFFEATGTYMAFNTCNSWVGRALKTSGVRTGAATPLPGTVLWYLPE